MLVKALVICTTWPDQEPTATVPSAATSMSSRSLNMNGAPLLLFSVTLC
jgi:hypothetical protein